VLLAASLGLRPRLRDGGAAHHAALLARAYERAAVAAHARAARDSRLTFGQDLPLFEAAKLYQVSILFRASSNGNRRRRNGTGQYRTLPRAALTARSNSAAFIIHR